MSGSPVTSLQNPAVKQLVRLRRRRERDQTGLFLVEGYRELTRAIEAGIEITTVYQCSALFLGANEQALVASAAAAGAEVVEMGEAAFRKVSYRDRPEGLLAVAPQFDHSLNHVEITSDPLLLVVEGIEKPGNLGTMLRTADAAGATAVVVCDPTTDPFNPNVVRSSLGTLFTVPLAVASTREAADWLDKRGIRVVATTPATSRLLWDTDLVGPVAVVIGSEQYGLSDAWLQRAGVRCRIPMAGRADSLNAAMAAGVALFEAVRQRSARSP